MSKRKCCDKSIIMIDCGEYEHAVFPIYSEVKVTIPPAFIKNQVYTENLLKEARKQAVLKAVSEMILKDHIKFEEVRDFLHPDKITVKIQVNILARV